MISYQLAVICIMATIIFTVLIIGSIEEIIKRVKQQKKQIAELKKENQLLKNQRYSFQYRAKLKGVDLDV